MSNGKMNDELETLQKALVLTQTEAISPHLPGGNEEKSSKPQRGQPIFSRDSNRRTSSTNQKRHGLSQRDRSAEVAIILTV